VQNSFLARFHLESWIRNYPSPPKSRAFPVNSEEKGRYHLSHPFSPRGGMRLDEDLEMAMEKLRRIDQIVKKFPGIDCGSCGCPSCLALAEDVVQSYATEKECVYVLKETEGPAKKKGKV